MRVTVRYLDTGREVSLNRVTVAGKQENKRHRNVLVRGVGDVFQKRL